MVRSSRLVSASVLLVVACSSSDSSSTPPLVSGTIGVAGGSIVVGQGEVSLTVPPNALVADVAFRIDPGQFSKVPGYIDVGPAYLFSPTSTTFAVPAEIVIPYTPTHVPGSVTDDELVVGFRSTTGMVSGITPQQIDPAAGRATLSHPELGTFWLVSPDVVAASSLFPLNDGDTYRYDTGMILTVSRTVVEPNFAPQEVVKVTFTRTGRTTGIYFDDRNSQLATRGSFDVADSQEQFASPVLLIAERDSIGTVRPIVTTYLGYVPFGSSRVGYSGLAEVTTEIAERIRVSVPLAAFDTVRVPITTRFSETRPLQGEERIEFWFADGVGPVQIRFGNSGVPDRLVEATVGGQPVTGD